MAIFLYALRGTFKSDNDMKKIFLIALLIGFGTLGSLQAQFTGDDADISTNDYGYNFDISLGKFKTETLATGWTISNSLAGGKKLYSVYNNNTNVNMERSGISSVGFGVGHFWQFYKHFNEHVGIFGGPSVNLGFDNSKTYTPDNGSLQETIGNKVTLGLNLSAGIYYQFSEKWWVTASLAFANPVSVSYQRHKYMYPDLAFEDTKVSMINYQISPVFTFPSVGLGVRYFYNR
jgi:hypothetical protein